jgi:hypothetical protein
VKGGKAGWGPVKREWQVSVLYFKIVRRISLKAKHYVFAAVASDVEKIEL